MNEHRNQPRWLTGAERRDTALATIEDCRAAVLCRARRVFVAKLLVDGLACADDVYPAVDLPSGLDPRCLGAVPKPFLAAGIIRAAGYMPSERPARNASIIRRWKLIDRDGAEKWLSDHPEPPDPLRDCDKKTRQLALPGVCE